MSSMKALNQIDGSELWKKVGFKHSEKVLVALRGVYNLTVYLNDPIVWLGAVHILRKHILGSLDTLGGVVSTW